MSVYEKDNSSYLEESISSILNQSFPTNDFVIIEDGPLSASLYEVLSKFKNHYPSVISIYSNTENKGLAFSLNRGLSLCKNRLVARMDADDISAPRRCEKELIEFSKNKDLVIVGTDMVEFSGDISDILSYKRMPSSKEKILKYSRRRSPFNHPSVMYDKNIILRLGGYNENNLRAEDFELFSLLVFKGFDCFNINEFLLYYRSNSSQLKRRFSFQSCESVILTQYKNYRMGYIRLSDLFYVFCAQIFGLFCPKFVLQKIFVFLYRNKK